MLTEGSYVVNGYLETSIPTPRSSIVPFHARSAARQEN